MKLRRASALAAAGLLVSALAGGAASADTPEAYVGSATARALNIDVAAADLQATLGATTASITSDLTAKAKATGHLTLLGNNTVDASSTKTKPTDSAGPVCENPALPAAVTDVVSIGIACAKADTSVVGGLPVATGEASVANLELKANSILSTLPIGDTLDRIFDPLTDTALDPVGTTLEDLVNSVLHTKTLTAEVGTSTSKVETTATHVNSTATAAGAVVKILPTPELTDTALSDIPLATIKITSASATASYDRVTGKMASNPTWTAALVTVELSPALGLPVSKFELAPKETMTILGDIHPDLETTITVADGRPVDNGDGTEGAVADGVSLHLLKGVGESAEGARDGGILLELAHAEAGVGGEPATVVLDCVLLPGQSSCDELPRVESPRTDHPRTGGLALLPGLGALLMGSAVVLRRLVTRAG